MTIPDIKHQIWSFTNQDLDRIKAAVKACQPEENTPQYWQRVLLYLQSQPVKTKAKRKVKEPEWVYERYNKAYRDYQAANFPTWVADGHTLDARAVDTSTANGLQTFIQNYLTWTGSYGNRINTTGRQLPDGKWIKGTTKRGTGDILACINGRMVFFEVKAGRDKASDKQLEQQRKVRASRGEYLFVRTAAEFLTEYEKLLHEK